MPSAKSRARWTRAWPTGSCPFRRRARNSSRHPRLHPSSRRGARRQQYPLQFSGESSYCRQYEDSSSWLARRRYYYPNDQGYEANIATRMEARAQARERRQPRKGARQPDPMASMGDGTRANMEGRKKLAETQKRDADQPE